MTCVPIWHESRSQPLVSRSTYTLLDDLQDMAADPGHVGEAFSRLERVPAVGGQSMVQERQFHGIGAKMLAEVITRIQRRISRVELTAAARAHGGK